MNDAAIGKFMASGSVFHLDLPKNTDDLIHNHLLVDQMGGGKTNLLMAIGYVMKKRYLATKAMYGALPIIFIPKFEWTKVELHSDDNNLAPGQDTDVMGGNHVTFPICNKPELVDIPQYAIPFGDLQPPDIATFIGKRDMKTLGAIKALRKKLGDNYSIKSFLDAMWKDGRDGEPELIDKHEDLWYKFSELEEKGFFDTQRYPIFSWKQLIDQHKPIIIHFGTVTDHEFQGIGGYLLRKLDELADKFYNEVLLKYHRYNQDKKLGLDPAPMSKEEKDMIKWFKLALLIDEAPRMMIPTTSATLTSFPAIKHFQTLSSNDGRKMGIKYTFLVTQYYKDIYYRFRKRSRFQWFGSRVSREDRDFLLTERVFLADDLPFILKNDKFYFSMVDTTKYENNIHSPQRAAAVARFKSFRSPCGSIS